MIPKAAEDGSGGTHLVVFRVFHGLDHGFRGFRMLERDVDGLREMERLWWRDMVGGETASVLVLDIAHDYAARMRGIGRRVCGNGTRR